MLVFEERGKPEYPEKNLSEQGREPTTNSTHIWCRRRDLNPGHIGGRQVLSPLVHHPCSKRVLTPSRPVALHDRIAFISWWVWLGVIGGKASFESQTLGLSTRAFSTVGSNCPTVLSASLSAKPMKCSVNTLAIAVSSCIYRLTRSPPNRTHPHNFSGQINP